MGSFGLRDPMVFAYEWASLDVISNGRTRLVACAGGGAGPLWEAETAAMDQPGIGAAHGREHARAAPSVDKDNAPFEGQFVKFANITLEPKPIQNPCPIWLAPAPNGCPRARRIPRGSSSRSPASARSPTAG
jgi:alkanesulfonate monooxygenase SsuD/methylene tetrahydromethanopterin reductase-like flavin-dependent oxidoreductase (luciferase family)